jgi:hypothetical protein
LVAGVISVECSDPVPRQGSSLHLAVATRHLDLDADALEGLGQLGELGESGLEVLDDLGGDDAGGGEVVGVLQALVAEPEDVETGLVTGDQLVVAEAAEPLALLALAPLAGLVAPDEVVEVFAG